MEASFLLGLEFWLAKKGFLRVRSEEKVLVFGKVGLWAGFTGQKWWMGWLWESEETERT